MQSENLINKAKALLAQWPNPSNFTDPTASLIDALRKAVDEAALPAADPVAWLVRRYDLEGVLLGTELSFVRPAIKSTSKTEMVPLFSPSNPTAQVYGTEASAGVAAIAAERHRQINDEGLTVVGDDKYERYELVEAAACYALHWTGEIACSSVPMTWPWSDEWWKPTTPIRDLAKAGALIAAEIDRLTRAEKASAKQEANR